MSVMDPDVVLFQFECPACTLLMDAELSTHVTCVLCRGCHVVLDVQRPNRCATLSGWHSGWHSSLLWFTLYSELTHHSARSSHLTRLGGVCVGNSVRAPTPAALARTGLAMSRGFRASCSCCKVRKHIGKGPECV